jgi:hypothetical protein
MSKPNPAFLRSFISYKGSKWQLAPRYPKPQRTRIIEPFAGAAGYSCLHYRHQVTLLEAHYRVADIWAYLRKASVKQIMALPDDVQAKVNINESLPHLKQVERDLMGYWFDKGQPEPTYTPSNWMLTHPNDMFWPKVKPRIASQLRYIRHWETHHARYRAIHNPEDPLMNCTLFIDPPYQLHGSMYSQSNLMLDYDELREIILQLHWSNQIIICEGEGANWMPFEFFCTGSRPTHSRDGDGINELVWYRAARDRRPAIGRGFDLDGTTRWLANLFPGEGHAHEAP